MDGLCGVTGYVTCDALKQAALATGACAVKKSAETIESLYNKVVSICVTNEGKTTLVEDICVALPVGLAGALGITACFVGVGALRQYATTYTRAAILSAIGMAGLSYAVTRLEC